MDAQRVLSLLGRAGAQQVEQQRGGQRLERLEDGVPVLRYELVYNAQGECGEAQPWYYLTPFNDMLSEANSVPEQFAQELIAALQELRVQLALTAFE